MRSSVIAQCQVVLYCIILLVVVLVNDIVWRRRYQKEQSSSPCSPLRFTATEEGARASSSFCFRASSFSSSCSSSPPPPSSFYYQQIFNLRRAKISLNYLTRSELCYYYAVSCRIQEVFIGSVRIRHHLLVLPPAVVDDLTKEGGNERNLLSFLLASGWLIHQHKN